MKKFFVCLSVILALMSGLSIQAVAADDISVEVNGEAVEFPDAKPFIDENGRVLVPLRPIADAMGMDVVWDEKNREAVFSRDYDENNFRLYDAGYGLLIYEKITFSIGSEAAVYYGSWAMINKSLIDGVMADVIVDTKEENRDVIMDTEAVIVDDRIYAPVRYLAEAIGYTVSWDVASRTVVITNDDYEPIPEPSITEPSVEPVLSDKALDELGFFSIMYLSVSQDTASYMDIYYDNDYEGFKVKDISVTSAKMDGADVSCELAPERDFRYSSYMEAVAAFEIGLPRGVSSYKRNKAYSFEFTVEIEYADGSKVSLNDSKLLYVR